MVLKEIFEFVKEFMKNPIYNMVLNPQVNSLVKWVNQVIYNIIFTNYPNKKPYAYIEQQRNILSYISW